MEYCLPPPPPPPKKKKKFLPVLKFTPPPVLAFFTPLLLSVLQSFNRPSTEGMKHGNTNLLQKFIIQYNDQQMEKTK